MDYMKYRLLAVANDCHTSFHKEMCTPCDLFEVFIRFNGSIYLIPYRTRYITHFLGSTMTFIADFLNKRGVSWEVVNFGGSVAISLLND